MAIGVNWAEIWAPVWAPVWTQVPPEPPVVPPSRQTGAGKSRKRRRYEVEIDGEVFDVDSRQAAEAVLAEAKAQAQTKADIAVEHATKAEKRTFGRTLKEGRRELRIPVIEAPDFSELAQQTSDQIQEIYEQAFRAIEILAHLRRVQALEDDDEEILLLL